MNKFLIIFALFIFVYGCNKEKPVQHNNEQNKQMDMVDNDTTSLTPAESFAAALCQNILNDETEVDLETYLIDAVYPKLSSSSKVTIDKISSSLFLIKYVDGNNEKYLLIQKYYNPQSDEIMFDMTETSLTTAKQFLK